LALYIQIYINITKQIYSKTFICGFRFQLTQQCTSRKHAVSSSNLQINEASQAKNDKTMHSVPHNHPVSFGKYNVSC